MKRFFIFLAEIIAALVVCFFIGIALLMVRLEDGPLSLASELPEIQGAISDLSPGLVFKIGKAELESSGERRALRMHLHDVSISNKKGQSVGSLKDIVLGFNWRNLTGMTVMPVSLQMIHPSLTITRFSNGYTGFNLQEVAPDADHAGSIDDLSTLLSHLPKGLRHVQVTDAELRYVDQQENTSFAAHKGILDFNRRRNDVSGTLSLDIDANNFKQRIQGTIVRDPVEKNSHLIIALKDFRLDQARSLIPAIPADLKLDMPFDILLTTNIALPLQVTSIDLQLTGKKGTMQYNPYFPQALPISDLFAKLEYLPNEKKFHLQSLGLNLEQSTILAVGTLTKTPNKTDAKQNDLNIALKALAEKVPVDKLPIYWPQGAAHNARDWVTTHISGGMAQRAVINVGAVMTPDKNVTIKNMVGRISFQNSNLDYLPPMPKITNITGQCRFTDKYFDIVATDGQMFDTKLVNATTRISDMMGENPSIKINVETNGPVRDGLNAVSSKPLEYAQKMKMVPANFSGNAYTNLTLSFPLLNDLKLDQVDIDLTSELQNLTAKNIVKDLGLSSKSLALKINIKELSLEGDAQLANASNHIVWHEYFDQNSQYNTTVDATGKVTPALLEALRINALKDYFKGDAQSEAHITIDHNHVTSVVAKGDLAQSQITIPELAIEKKQGVAGNLDLKLTSDDQGVTNITDSNISWKDFSIANAALKISDANGLESADLKDIRSGRSKAEVSVTPNGPNSIKAIIKADTLDLSGYWSKKKTLEKPSKKRIDLSLRAKKFFLDKEIPFTNFIADIVVVGKDLQHGLVTGKTDEGGNLVLQQLEAKNRSRKLTIKIDNAGRVLQALDITDAVHGGTLTIIGDSTPKDPSVIIGKLLLNKFVMVKAPVLARLINALSPGGLLNLLNTKGLAFSKLESNYTLPDPDTIKLSKGKMTGDSLGLSFGGSIDRLNSTLDINGTIIPIEGINKLANIIPVLGKILTGVNGNGIFAATYKVSGSTDNPSVFVNPLSVLTPGILRSIFFESSDD